MRAWSPVFAQIWSLSSSSVVAAPHSISHNSNLSFSGCVILSVIVLLIGVGFSIGMVGRRRRTVQMVNLW